MSDVVAMTPQIQEPEVAGRRLRRLRELSGLTQAQVAEAAGLAANTISALECGRSASAVGFAAVCEVLGHQLGRLNCPVLSLDDGLRLLELHMLGALAAATVGDAERDRVLEAEAYAHEGHLTDRGLEAVGELVFFIGHPTCPPPWMCA